MDTNSFPSTFPVPSYWGVREKWGPSQRTAGGEGNGLAGGQTLIYGLAVMDFERSLGWEVWLFLQPPKWMDSWVGFGDSIPALVDISRVALTRVGPA